MKPVKGWWSTDDYGDLMALFDTPTLPDDLQAEIVKRCFEQSPCLICSDPGLTEEEINALKFWMEFCIEHPAQFEIDKHFDTAYPKLLKMAGVI
jgi:hypothetical protein